IDKRCEIQFPVIRRFPRSCFGSLTDSRWPQPSSENPTSPASWPMLTSISRMCSARFFSLSPRALKSTRSTQSFSPCCSTLRALSELPLTCPALPCSVMRSLPDFRRRCGNVIPMPAQLKVTVWPDQQVEELHHQVLVRALEQLLRRPNDRIRE
ncbi:hypothetical protein BN1708_008225, partial [Verticillium longisporum]